MPAITASAPGKIILCGEHAVVYGAPAIALPVFQVSTKTTILARPTAAPGEVTIIAPCINLDDKLEALGDQQPLKAAANLVKEELGLSRLQACEIRINSSIPLAAGLGSSASVTVSMVRALSQFLGHPLEPETVNRIAFEVEKIHHGTPSGIDNTVITYQTPVFFRKDSPIEHLKIHHGFTLVIADSGTSISTAETVTGVRERRQANRERYDDLISRIGELSLEIRHILCTNDLLTSGDLLTKNHNLLIELGVSTPMLDRLVNAALAAGAAGAKLSGGGGGGNIIAIVDPSMAAGLASSLEENGAVRTIITHMHAEGGIA